MTLPHLALAVIGDEIGPSLDEMISFCAENGVKRLDMRTVDGKNLMSMTPSEVAAIGIKLEKAGIRVPTFVSPTLKWAAKGQEGAAGKVDFAFDPALCPSGDALVHACDVATALGATELRIFSHLRYPGFQSEDLLPAIERLMDLSGRHMVTMHLENEPVCNLGSIAELAHFFGELPDLLALADIHVLPILPLVDIGNSWGMGAPPNDADIAMLAPTVRMIHLKDRDMEAKRTVPLGDGDIPWADELKRLLAGVEAREVIASIETHCPQDGRNATARSVAALRRIAGEIGVEVV
jgi:sugar phosphate isomerase/epimerase